uniref:Peptidase S1 domain-containing protein n=1 Tax=Megaselia scalaris TaxID=36166 RepID=T1GGZ8_MEGSC
MYNILYVKTKLPQRKINAAHCFLYNSGKNVKVRLGSTYLNSGGVVVNVTNITVHPDFNYVSFKYDIAILKLEPAPPPNLLQAHTYLFLDGAQHQRLLIPSQNYFKKLKFK